MREKMGRNQLYSLCSSHFTTVLLLLIYITLVTVDAVDYSKYTIHMLYGRYTTP